MLKQSLFLTLAISLMLGVLPPVARAGDEAPEISRPEPQQAVVNIPTTFYVTASDVDGVASCTFIVSSVHETPMVFNTALDRWQASYTFTELRTANSIRARCSDSLGNDVIGPPRVIPVLEIDLTSNDGNPEGVTPAPETVDATTWTQQQVIDVSPVLVKTVCPGGEDVNHPCRAVYFVDNMGRRHAFPHSKVYFTWYTEFRNIHLVTDAMMASFSLGHNVRYHPGKRLVKFPTLNTVFAVLARGVLRPIGSEAVASALYGHDWNTKVDDISEAFYGNYTYGEPIVDVAEYNVNAQTSAVVSINDNLNLTQ
ncbi:MAG: hypothetical protein O2877_02640 [bacterium]|nr:hypothetical protein [bacterium]